MDSFSIKEQEMRTILVTGDPIISHNIYCGKRFRHENGEELGSSIDQSLGGSFFINNINDCFCNHLNKKGSEEVYKTICGIKSIKKEEFGQIPSWMHEYSTWATFPAKVGKHNVWRLKDNLGYGTCCLEDSKEYPFTVSRDNEDDCDIAVIADNALGYRFHPSLWPRFLKENQANKPDWVILKMSHPICKGDLWRKLRSDYQDRLILTVSSDDLRKLEVMISTGRSWERTIQDILVEIETNPALSAITNCKHLVITFDTEGVLWISNPDSVNRSCRLVFDPEYLEGQWKNGVEGQSIHNDAFFLAGFSTQLIQSKPENKIENGLHAGLNATRQSILSGHGRVSSVVPSIPLNEIIESTSGLKRISDFCSLSIDITNAISKKNWTFIEEKAPQSSPLYGQAWQVALRGEKALRGIPYARFGVLFTVDKNEIESLNNIRQLINDYIASGSSEKPLSLGVFGPPGSGKSFVQVH